MKVKLAAPRGFCAGVERAIRTVEDALAEHGAPVYVRHEIVHNRHVVDRLSAMGAIFIESLDEARNDRPVIFSAHGAPQTAHRAAADLGLTTIDATCPLVLKVHTQVRRHCAAGRHVILIGHANHQEVIGTMGQAPEGAVTLIQTIEDAMALDAPSGPLAYATQTTLSLDDTAGIISALKSRFPQIHGPSKEDICYATSNRQNAVKASAPGTDLFIVVGSPESSNSVRLVETALAAGAKSSMLVNDVSEFDLSLVDSASTIGISSGASAPEHLVEELLTALAQRHNVIIETVETAQENIVFKTPLKRAS